MAQTEHLPIYKGGVRSHLHLEQVVARFARTHRYGLGAEPGALLNEIFPCSKEVPSSRWRICDSTLPLGPPRLSA
jgi:hypothetical protein